MLTIFGTNYGPRPRAHIVTDSSSVHPSKFGITLVSCRSAARGLLAYGAKRYLAGLCFTLPAYNAIHKRQNLILMARGFVRFRPNRRPVSTRADINNSSPEVLIDAEEATVANSRST